MTMLSKIPKNVLVLGLVSFFNDVASEMIYPLMPIFLTSILGAPVAVVGFIEGVAEGTAAITKFIFGYISDRMRARKPFVTAGYTFGTISKILVGFSYHWGFVLFARFLDRLGKGLRTSARDALLLENATPQNKGYIFGVHRAMDSAGAVVGPLLALLILQLYHNNIRDAFFISVIPAAVGVVLLLILIKEKHIKDKNSLKEFPLAGIMHIWRGADKRFKYFFFVSMIFALGNSSDAFLLLQAKNLGFTTTLVVLAYVLYNVSQTFFSTPGGKLSDLLGAKKVFSFGLIIFAIVYFFFGFIHNPFWMWLLFPFYGIYIASTDGVSKAYISEFIQKENAGSYFGLYLMGTALATFLASFVAGILWSTFSPSVTFWYGSIMALFSFLLLVYGRVFRNI